MKILFLACFQRNKGGNIYGGAEKSITNLANWIAESTDNTVVLASVEGAEKPYKISDKVSFIGCDITLQSKLYTHFQIFKNVRRIIKYEKPDMVVSFWIQPIFYLVMNGYGRKIKYIYSERNDPSMEYGKIAKIMRTIALKYANGIVFQTKEARDYFPEIIKEKSKIIHNPVYLKYDAYPLKEEFDNRIVSVGRLNQQKNYRLDSIEKGT